MDASFEAFSYTSEEHEYPPKRRGPKIKIKKAKAGPAKMPLIAEENPRAAYKNRKDVIFKRILRGCRKFYHQAIVAYSQIARKEAFSEMVKG